MEGNDSLGKLKSKKADLQAKLARVGGFDEATARKEQMALLHEYNEAKDAAQAIIGALANLDSVTIRCLHDKFNLPLDSWAIPPVPSPESEHQRAFNVSATDSLSLHRIFNTIRLQKCKETKRQIAYLIYFDQILSRPAPF